MNAKKEKYSKTQQTKASHFGALITHNSLHIWLWKLMRQYTYTISDDSVLKKQISCLLLSLLCCMITCMCMWCCRDDYYSLFAPRCGGCGHPISEQFITALNQQWHTHCFVCAVCIYCLFWCIWRIWKMMDVFNVLTFLFQVGLLECAPMWSRIILKWFCDLLLWS